MLLYYRGNKVGVVYNEKPALRRFFCLMEVYRFIAI